MVAVAHVLLVAVTGDLLLRGAWSLGTRRPSEKEWFRLFTGTGSETAFLQSAALWGYGVLLTVLAPTVYRHYLFITFPLTWVWLSRLAFASAGRSGGRVALATLWVAQFTVTACFLHYIHVNGGAPGGDYGIAYSRQPPGRQGLGMSEPQ